MPTEPECGVPEETTRVARAAFPKGNVYLILRDELNPIYDNELFADLFSHTGQPAESPWRLALVTILQFAEELSDRQAADAVRGRIDWKYLLGLPLEDAGFHYSVLSEFRDRLVAGHKEQRLLDDLLARFRQRGLLKTRSQQRTDSTHVVAAVRNLNRLELVGETLRFALERLAVSAPAWLQARVPDRWYERYGARFEQARLPKTLAAREELAVQIGQDGYQLLRWAYAADSPKSVQQHPAVDILRQIWLQQYYREDETVFWRASANLPPSGQAIASPYDLEARFSIKRQTEWLGYKVHLSEICEDQQPHWITQVETTPATVQDVAMVDPIHAALAAKGLHPRHHFLDMGYVDTQVLADSQQNYGVAVIGPIQQDNTWQAKSEEGLDVTRFAIDWQQKQVICPHGKSSQSWQEAPDKTGAPRIYVRFAAHDCQPCPLRAHCTRAAHTARTLTFKPRPAYELLQWARARGQSPEFRQQYKRRAGIEGTLSQGTRSFDLRRTRYLGLAKTHLQHVLTAIAINLIRFVNWVEAIPLDCTRLTAFAKLAPLVA
ncbi:MAG: IS1182 family transposase [Chloroflexi bacterium]|nr:MAG: IS1182 family transposase [Chloroflexota bacterium]